MAGKKHPSLYVQEKSLGLAPPAAEALQNDRELIRVIKKIRDSARSDIYFTEITKNESSVSFSIAPPPAELVDRHHPEDALFHLIMERDNPSCYSDSRFIYIDSWTKYPPSLKNIITTLPAQPIAASPPGEKSMAVGLAPTYHKTGL